MEIKAKGYDIQMTFDELWDLYYIYKNAISYSIITHWKDHSDVWQAHEKPRLEIMKKIADKLGEGFWYEDTMKYFEDLLKKEMNKKVKITENGN